VNPPPATAIGLKGTGSVAARGRAATRRGPTCPPHCPPRSGARIHTGRPGGGRGTRSSSPGGSRQEVGVAGPLGGKYIGEARRRTRAGTRATSPWRGKPADGAAPAYQKEHKTGGDVSTGSLPQPPGGGAWLLPKDRTWGCRHPGHDAPRVLVAPGRNGPGERGSDPGGAGGRRGAGLLRPRPYSQRRMSSPAEERASPIPRGVQYHCARGYRTYEDFLGRFQPGAPPVRLESAPHVRGRGAGRYGGVSASVDTD